MQTKIMKIIGLSLVLLAVMALLTSQPALAQPQPPPNDQPALVSVPAAAAVIFNLCASTGSVMMPDGVSIPIWGYSNLTTSGCDPAQLPGPVLRVTQGDVVTVNLTNSLPVPTSILFPGQTGVTSSGGSAGAFTAEAGSGGGTVSYTFTAGEPGTYLYESGTADQPQTAMGLYGALIVDSATPGQAYSSGSTAYEEEAILVLGEIDPELNANPSSFNLLDYNPTYWLINGRAYPDVLDPDAPGTSQPYSSAINTGDRLLVRYVNAGATHHTMSLLDRYQRVIARTAVELTGGQAYDAVAETIPSGQTTDVIIDPTGAVLNSTFPLFNRQLHLTNGAPPGDLAPGGGGGMMTFVTVTGAGGPTNNPPVAVDDSGAPTYSVNQGGTLNVAVPGVLGNDNDGGDGPGPFTAVLNTGPANASSFTLNPNGSFSYTHNGSATTSDSFTYHANDGSADSNVATVTITIVPATMHVGDLDRFSANTPLFTWTAVVTVTVHKADHTTPVNGALVTGTWVPSTLIGSNSCTTNSSGQCAVSRTRSRLLSGGLTFTVTTVTSGTLTYQSADNHDPDGSPQNSNGTTITAPMP